MRPEYRANDKVNQELEEEFNALLKGRDGDWLYFVSSNGFFDIRSRDAALRSYKSARLYKEDASYFGEYQVEDSFVDARGKVLSFFEDIRDMCYRRLSDARSFKRSTAKEWMSSPNLKEESLKKGFL